MAGIYAFDFTAPDPRAATIAPRHSWHASRELSPDRLGRVEYCPKKQVTESGKPSEDEVLRDALGVFREFQARKDQLLADVQLGIDRANQGLARPLDIDALIDRLAQKLAENGVNRSP